MFISFFHYLPKFDFKKCKNLLTLPNKYGQDETMICLVKSINTSDTQTISLMNVSTYIIIEDFLDIDSTNIVQNKVITQEFNKVYELLGWKESIYGRKEHGWCSL